VEKVSINADLFFFDDNIILSKHMSQKAQQLRWAFSFGYIIIYGINTTKIYRPKGT
jgi:hypothetical protein